LGLYEDKCLGVEGVGEESDIITFTGLPLRV